MEEDKKIREERKEEVYELVKKILSERIQSIPSNIIGEDSLQIRIRKLKEKYNKVRQTDFHAEIFSEVVSKIVRKYLKLEISRDYIHIPKKELDCLPYISDIYSNEINRIFSGIDKILNYTGEITTSIPNMNLIYFPYGIEGDPAFKIMEEAHRNSTGKFDEDDLTPSDKIKIDSSSYFELRHGLEKRKMTEEEYNMILDETHPAFIYPRGKSPVPQDEKRRYFAYWFNLRAKNQ